MCAAADVRALGSHCPDLSTDSLQQEEGSNIKLPADLQCLFSY